MSLMHRTINTSARFKYWLNLKRILIFFLKERWLARSASQRFDE